jgi:hypothetical protein
MGAADNFRNAGRTRANSVIRSTKQIGEFGVAEHRRLIDQWSPVRFQLLGVLFRQRCCDGLLVREIVVQSTNRRTTSRGQETCESSGRAILPGATRTLFDKVEGTLIFQ